MPSCYIKCYTTNPSISRLFTDHVARLLLLMNEKGNKKKKKIPQLYYSSMEDKKQITELGNYLFNVLACCSQKPEMTLDEMPA